MANIDRRPTKITKIEEAGLVEVATKLLCVTPKLSYKEIAEQLNEIGGITENKITEQNVITLRKNNKAVRSAYLTANRQRMRKLIMDSSEFDMLRILKDLAARLSFSLDVLENNAIEEGEIPDAKDYKALSSELRDTLKQIKSIQKEIYDMNVVREFLVEVVKTLKETSPETLPVFISKMKGKRDNTSIVNELLRDGVD